MAGSHDSSSNVCKEQQEACKYADDGCAAMAIETHIVRLHVSVHDALRVTIIQGLHVPTPSLDDQPEASDTMPWILEAAPVNDARKVGTFLAAYLEQLEDVIPDVVVGKCRVQNLEVCVVHILEDETGCLGLRISDDIQKLDDIRAPAKVLKNFDLPLDLHAADRIGTQQQMKYGMASHTLTCY